LSVDRYAEILHGLGYERQHVRLQVYGHLLGSTADVVEWVKGTSLTRFKRVLPPADFEQFLEEYRARLVAHLGDQQPYFYPFKRILFWGRASA
jgi:trans-aconitate 2-methyltransferase